MMIVLLMMPLLFGSFALKESISYGTSGPNGRVMLGDFNRNSKIDVIFTGYSGIYAIGMVFERQDSGVYVLVDTVGFYLAVWDVGDFDADGFYDLVTDGDYFIGITIYESPDSFSYPTQEVWRDTVGPPLVLPISAYDIDQDGLAELVKNRATPYGYIGIYESVGNNQYELIFADDPDTSGLEAPAATHAFGDFDEDSKIECVFAGGDEWYWIYESPENNTYEKVSEGQLPTGNIRDCFSVPDIDGDGKLEFVVKGFIVPTARVNAFIFEATGDNTYEIIKSFDLFGGSNDYYGGYSDVGDVDGDSIPEIALEACQNIYIIKAAGNDSFYVWDYIYGNNSGSSVRVYDIDNNGLAEVIISGNNQTRIYEYEVGIAEDIVVQNPARTFEVQPNPFADILNIRFQARSKEEINFDIYDVSGRLIKNLRSGTFDGYNVLVWHGDDDYGREVSEGIYFVRVEYSDLRETLCRKVIKTK